MKNTPGPRAPPVSSRPSLKMTALSYSWSRAGAERSESLPWPGLTWTTLTTVRREKGRVVASRRTEIAVRKKAKMFGPSCSQPAKLDTADCPALPHTSLSVPADIRLELPSPSTSGATTGGGFMLTSDNKLQSQTRHTFKA